MNKQQQLILLVGLVLVIAMGLYPPWVHIDEDKVTHAMGYADLESTDNSTTRLRQHFWFKAAIGHSLPNC